MSDTNETTAKKPTTKLTPEQETKYSQVIDDYIEYFRKDLPPIIKRNDILFVEGKIGIDLENIVTADNFNQGVDIKFKVGTKIGYAREDFLTWVRQFIGVALPKEEQEKTKTE